MNREDILGMAKEAGLVSLDATFHMDEFLYIERFFHLAYAAGQGDERAAISKLLDDVEAAQHDQWNDTRSSYHEGYRDCADICAAAIRTRGEK